MATGKDDDRRGAMVSVRYADGEMERVRSAAEKQGSSVSAFIRKASLSGQKQETPFSVQPGTCNVPTSPQSGWTLTLAGGVPVLNL